MIVGCGSAGSRGKKNRNRNDGCFLLLLVFHYLLFSYFVFFLSFFLLMHIHALFSFLSVHLKPLLRILPHSLYFISHPFIVAFPYSSLCCLRLLFFSHPFYYRLPQFLVLPRHEKCTRSNDLVVRG